MEMERINIMNKEIKLLNKYKYKMHNIKTKCDKLLSKPSHERKDKIDRISKQIFMNNKFKKYQNDNAIETVTQMTPRMNIQFGNV